MAVARCVLPVPEAADEDSVTGAIGEGQITELFDQRSIDLGRGEGESGQVAMSRKLGRAHLIADRMQDATARKMKRPA